MDAAGRMAFALLAIGLALAPAARPTDVAAAERSVEADGPSGKLAGTLRGPGTAPVVLVIPGSGPTDRDGNSPGGILAAPYRMLAQALAAQGVTTLRIDKRGMFGSAAPGVDPNAVTLDDNVADMRAWVAALRKQTGASCIWLLGHSEGGLVAIATATAGGKTAGDVCGLLLLATPGRPMGEVLRAQLRANPANAPILPQAEQAIDALTAGKRVETSGMHPALAPLFAQQVQGFLVSMFAFDPAHALAGYRKPVLVLQGKRDIQVSEADAQLLKQADAQATLILLPDMNHVLKTVTSDDVGANVATYADSSLPLAPGVADGIGRFLLPEHAPALSP